MLIVALGAALLWLAIAGVDPERPVDGEPSDVFVRAADPTRPLPADVRVTGAALRAKEMAQRGRPAEEAGRGAPRTATAASDPPR